MNRQRVCRDCGNVFVPKSYAGFVCDVCLAKKAKARPEREIVCEMCKSPFYSSSYTARFCPDCRHQRKLAAYKAYHERKAAGNVRPIGSTDICERCGERYFVDGGLQKYCPECQKDIKCEKSLIAYYDNDAEINAKRRQRRKVTEEELRLNTREKHEVKTVSRNIRQEASGFFRVTCYYDNDFYYLGTWPSLDDAVKVRDGFSEALKAGELDAYLTRNKSQRKHKQASYLTLKGETDAD